MRTLTPKNVLLMISPYSQPRLDGIARFAKEHRWNLMMADRLSDEEDPLDYDGVLITLRDTPAMVKLARRLAKSGVPVVDMTIERPDIPFARVVSDHSRIAAIAARHFTERGFSNFAWFSSGASNVHAMRCRSFMRSLPKKAVSMKWSTRGIVETLKAAPKPVAVLCYNDVDAARLVVACRVAGCSVPDDVAIIGIGNDTFLCENQEKPISSVEQNLERNAYEGAELLHRLMGMTPEERAAAAAQPPPMTPPGRVVPRESSDTLAHADPDVRAALVYIHSHLGEPFGAADVARGIGMPRHRLDKVFTAAMHRPVGEEILRQRMERAKRMLLDGADKISTVARSCGFCNSAYFTNTFRRETRMTPKKWREAQAR